MGFFHGIKNIFTRNTGQDNDPDIWDLPGAGGDNSPLAWSASVQEYLEKYATSTTLQTPARRAAWDVALLKTYLYRQLDGIAGPSGPPKEQLWEHDFLTLWKQPNPMLVNFQFTYLTQIYLDIGKGECHWVIERKPGELKPDALWPIPKHWVSHHPTPDRPFWQISINGKSMPEPLPAGEVIWLHDPNPLNPYYQGLGVAPSLDDDIQQDEWMDKFNNQFFRNGGHPGAVYGLEGVEKDVAKQIKLNYDKNYGGFWNAFKVAWLGVPRGGKIHVHQLRANHKDMDFVQGKNQRRDRALQAFNMQRFEVGINEDVNRASAQASEDGKGRNVTLPRATYLEQAINAYLLPLYGDSRLVVVIENPVKATREFKLAQASEGLVNGAITVDEWRVANGWDPLPGGKGNVLRPPLNVGSESIGRALAELRQVDPEAADFLERTLLRNA